jgi:hypothetical protein
MDGFNHEMPFIEGDERLRNIAVATACLGWHCISEGASVQVNGRCANRKTTDYDAVVNKVRKLQLMKPLLFTRMYRLSPKSFDRTLGIIQADLFPRKERGCNFVPPIIKLCLGLRLLAGGSYLDLSFAYDVPPNTVHKYAWQSLNAIDRSTDPFLDNIKSPTHCTAKELDRLENGFAALSQFKLHGTVAAGDGIVFRMVMPTNEQVDGDVTAYYTRKGYFAYGLQV